MAAAALLSNSMARLIIGTGEEILYQCSCKTLKPISRLYFCRHCSKLRCPECVSHEVDSYYCPNCLENMPSAEAKLKKNRCGNCFDCPSCSNTLVIRATAINVPSSPLGSATESGKSPATKKMHYLFCSFCRWTSRDAGLEDQPTASGGWPELEHPNAKHISALTEYYKHVAHQEKLEREKKKLTKRRTYLHLMDRYGLALSLGKKKPGSPSSALASAILGKSKVSEVALPKLDEPVSEVEELPDEYYTKQIIIEEVPSIQQRLAHPVKQPSECRDFYPRHKQMLVRRSMRCKECEHNLSKPEFNPSSVKFKIQLGAMNYTPQLKIAKVPLLRPNKEEQIVLTITNPTDSVMHVNFRQVEEGDEDFEQRTAEIHLPKVPVPIAAKDASTEFDEFDVSTDYFEDDPKVIQSRQANKVWFYARVKPLNSPSEGTKCIFKMSFEYKVITASIPRPSETEKKPVKSGETTIGLQILVHLNIAGSYAAASSVEADFEDPLDAKMKTELATEV
ncbi:dynactin subunit 4-like [Rhopilema esculentum]|uniref:dynactin subunit 4-like n=1 Tax=Rhopilema esculentum TaxID=499914 RepID=UPI0031D97180